MWRRWLFLGLLPIIILATGCQATGTGAIPSLLFPGDKATFGFIAVSDATGLTQDFSGSYHDPQGQTAIGIVDVAFKGVGGLQKCQPGVDPACAQAPNNVKGGCYVGLALQYQSQNPNIPGSGTFFLLACDVDGTGGNGTDFLLITVESGPYTGYSNAGTPSGNLTVTL